MFKPTLLAAATATGVLPFALHADENEPSTPMIVITGRAPETAGLSSAHIQIISRTDIENSGARNIADLLQRSAIIQLIDANGDGSSPALAMRGFGENGAQNSLVMINGRRLNNDTDIAVADLRNLALETVDHIEIVNGSAGALYGNGAIGGIVNIITRQAKGNEATVGVSRGSHDLEQYRLNATGHLAGLTASVQGEKDLGDNYRKRNELDRSLLQGRLAYDFGDSTLYAEASDQKALQNHPGALFTPAYEADPRQARYPGDFSRARNKRYTLGADLALNGDWMLTLEGTHRDDDVTGRLSVGGTPSDIVQNRTQDSLNPRLNGQWVVSPDLTVKVVTGYDQDKGTYHFESSLGPMDDRQTLRGLYAQTRLLLKDRLEIALGGRHAEYRAFMQDGFTYTNGVNLSDNIDVGSVGLYFSPVEAVRTWLRMDDNFRFATLDEQTNIPFGTVKPLKTQTGRSWETGMEYKTSGMNTSLQLYRLQLENEIAFDANTFANGNLDKTRRDGATLGFGVDLTPVLSLNTQLAWIDAEFTDGPSKGKQVPLVARTNAFAGLAWLPAESWSLTLEGTRQGSRYPGSDWSNSLAKLDHQYLTNIAASYRLQGLKTQLRVNNLLDKRNVAYASLGYPFPWPSTATDTAYMAGPGRTLTLSVDYTFR